MSTARPCQPGGRFANGRTSHEWAPAEGQRWQKPAATDECIYCKKTRAQVRAETRRSKAP